MKGKKRQELYIRAEKIGRHSIDNLTESPVILDIKAVESINKISEAPLLAYLKARIKVLGY
jgi:hypothetical protein